MTANVTDWIAYAALRGETVINEPASDQALVRATDYIRSAYPFAIADPLPAATVEAIYIAASIDLANPGFWAKTWTEGDRKVLTEVGASIKWTLPDSGSSAGARAVTPRSTLIEGLIGGRFVSAVLVV